jgi:hypothetical protein
MILFPLLVLGGGFKGFKGVRGLDLARDPQKKFSQKRAVEVKRRVNENPDKRSQVDRETLEGIGDFCPHVADSGRHCRDHHAVGVRGNRELNGNKEVRGMAKKFKDRHPGEIGSGLGSCEKKHGPVRAPGGPPDREYGEIAGSC